MDNMPGMSNMSNMSNGGHRGHDDAASGMAFPDFGSAGPPFDASYAFVPSEFSLAASTPAGSANSDEQLL
jgi:hypothetical protein